MTFPETSTDTGGARTVVDVELAPGGGVRIHYHKTDTETFEVLAGELKVQPEKNCDAPQTTPRNVREILIVRFAALLLPMRIFLSFAAALLLLIRCGTSGPSKPSFEEISGIKFPEGFQIIEQLDNGRQQMAMMIQVPPNKIAAFSKQFAFKSIDSVFVSRSFRGNRLLKAEHKAPAFGSGFLVKEGCSEHRYWIMYLDPQSGKIWCLLEYPDANGATPC